MANPSVSQRRLVIGGLILAILASFAGFPFEPRGEYHITGFLFVVFALGLFIAAGLLGIQAGRDGDNIAALGFAGVALYGVGTTLNSSLLARELFDASVGIQPGVWAMLAVGLVFVSLADRFALWTRVIGFFAGVGHGVAASAVLLGAELPPTGAEPTDPVPMIVAVSKVLLWLTLVGWVLALRKSTGKKPPQRHPNTSEST